MVPISVPRGDRLDGEEGDPEKAVVEGMWWVRGVGKRRNGGGGVVGGLRRAAVVFFKLQCSY